jgi:hypothetical protein
LTEGFTCFGGSSFLIILAESILWMFSFETYCFASRLLFCWIISSHFLLSSVWSFNLSAYLRVFRLWSDDELPGEMHAIMITFAEFDLFTNESLKIKVSFEALNGTWSALSSIALIHYFKASKLNYLIVTFCWFKLLPDAFVCCYFGYLELVNCLPNRPTPVFHRFIRCLFLSKFGKSHEISMKYRLLQSHESFCFD